MKKLVILLLALVLLVGMSSIAFAFEGTPDWFSKWKSSSSSGASINGDIYKKIEFENKAKTETGDAEATANISETCVDSIAEAKATDDSALADNDSNREVSNTGTADALSGVADSLNEANNNEEECIEEQAQATSDCSVFVEGTIDCEDCLNNEHVYTDSNRDGSCDFCDCCPAEVCGDICIEVEYDNEADAETGDAYATGNVSSTKVDALGKAIATNGATASNDDCVEVVNDGVATATSGNATSTNLANNDVKINIFRGALSAKTIDILVDFLAQ